MRKYRIKKVGTLDGPKFIPQYREWFSWCDFVTTKKEDIIKASRLAGRRLATTRVICLSKAEAQCFIDADCRDLERHLDKSKVVEIEEYKPHPIKFNLPRGETPTLDAAFANLNHALNGGAIQEDADSFSRVLHIRSIDCTGLNCRIGRLHCEKTKTTYIRSDKAVFNV